VVIFYNGFDVTKEILYGIIGEVFADRGIACLVIDTPGTGRRPAAPHATPANRARRP
jgi:hypothetical protein